MPINCKFFGNKTTCSFSTNNNIIKYIRIFDMIQKHANLKKGIIESNMKTILVFDHFSWR
jgi:hypothetical protein